jgi:putative protein-disulfide isomerase
MSDRELVYLGDPLCSWCWGFAPVLEKLPEALGLPLKVVCGGMSPGDGARVIDEKTQSFLGGCWSQVEEASGQPFDHGQLAGMLGWRYDSEPPSLAVVAVREAAPDKAMAFFADVQHAFYAEGRDVTSKAVLAELMAPYVQDVDLADPELKKRTWADFAFAHKLGVRAFPTLLLREGDKLSLITQGFRPLEQLEQPLRTYLSSQSPG